MRTKTLVVKVFVTVWKKTIFRMGIIGMAVVDAVCGTVIKATTCHIDFGL